ncbi:MAG: hypothetical protein R3E42_14795 [Burkholderiaceae bacterium]
MVRSKRFEVMADELSGRIPVTRLESWRDFTQLLESSFFSRHGVQLVFAGIAGTTSPDAHAGSGDHQRHHHRGTGQY